MLYGNILFQATSNWLYVMDLQNCQKGVLQAYFVYESFTVAVEDFFVTILAP